MTNVTFNNEFTVELVGDFSSDLSTHLEQMKFNQEAYSFRQFIDAILIGYDCGVSEPAINKYVESLRFNGEQKALIKKELKIFIDGEHEYLKFPE